MKISRKLTAMLALLSCIGTANAASFVIDSFNISQATITDNVVDGASVTSQQAVVGVLGGYRELFVEKLTQVGGDTGDLGIAVGVTGGKLRYSSDTDAAGYGVVRWDGASAGPAINATGLGSLDLSAVGNAFVFNVTAADGPFTMTLLAMSGAGQSSSYVVTGSSVGIYSVTFANLVNPSAALTTVGGGVDLSHLGALQLTISGGLGLDVSIDMLEVPEPVSLALVGLGLIGASATRRRKAAK